MVSTRLDRIKKLALVMALIVGVMVVGLFGNQSSRALAQDAQPQTYMIQAGSFGLSNVEYIAFAPNSLKIHQGDTVMWHFNSFHNVHFEDKAAELIIAPVVDGNPLPQVNPAVAFPTIKSGDTYKGGEANTGLPIDPSAPLSFSMVIDLPPGNYIYYCDVHPGMVGSLEVVANDVAVPSPIEALQAAADEVSAQLNQAGSTVEPNELTTLPATPTDGKLTIDAGTGKYGRISIQAFSAPLAVVNVGDSVTWTIPTDSVEPHTVTSTNFVGDEFVPQPQPNGPPVVALGAVFAPSASTSIGAADNFNSGFLTPGQSYSVTFTEPGVHSYVCRLHDGMFGVVVVQPKA